MVGLASQHVRAWLHRLFGDGPDYDERQHAHPIVERFDADAAERRVEPDDLLGTLKQIVWHLDEPSLAMGVFPQWHVMALARDGGVKVVLDGQGGDEVFAGYTNYAPQHLYGLLGSEPSDCRDGRPGATQGCRGLPGGAPALAMRPSLSRDCGCQADAAPSIPTCCRLADGRTTSGGFRASSTVG